MKCIRRGRMRQMKNEIEIIAVDHGWSQIKREYEIKSVN